ncbi:chitin synthase-domain-containing protein [Halteromyces radiatus]|uniref:chitin synthase-domain-containing protein n=1 Tax=Halteromyces radiatus TaxID=101107 RepID=UPI00222006D7|nr:chitin synthase-domain-containing protein [Halteromyces radiatus]KAI8081506.1 chitin synthase-domain-containing protein [Halteromyces radiatus]
MRVRHPSRMHVPTVRRIVWVTLSRLCTFFLPDFILHYVFNLNSPSVRQAWREKITMMGIFLFCAAFFCFWLEYISTLFCDQNKYYSSSAVFSKGSRMAGLRQNAIDWHGSTTEMAKQVNQYSGYDVSPMFPTFMGLQRNTSFGADPPYDNPVFQRCIGNFGMSSKADQWLEFKLNNDQGYLFKDNQLVSCPYPTQPNVTGAPCYYLPQDIQEEKSLGTKGNIVYDITDIELNYTTLSTASTLGKGFVILDNDVLDVTSYLESATNIVLVANGVHSRAFAIDRMFLPLDLTTLLYLKLGSDITPYFEAGNITSDSETYRGCLRDMFQVGITSNGKVEECLRINPALWATMGCGLLYFLIKMNLANLSRLKWVQRSLFKSNPEFSTGGNSRVWPMTILMIPCYAENAETIRDTLNSLARTNYDDSRKMLMFVCDGVVQSSQDTKETYTCVLEALGCSTAQATTPHAYVSLGQHRRKINFAKVYSGFYETGRNRVPFMVIVKVGAPGEISVGRAPGNRGKRDSMLLVLGFLERCTNLASNRMTPLEYELFNQCYNVLGIDPRRFKYMMVTDADTQVQNDVVHKLVARLERDRRMLAVSGHIRPANPEQNVITMLQIFPLYMTFFTGLAYEACLGNVLTINGGLVMYKIWTENTPSPSLGMDHNNNINNNNDSSGKNQLRWRMRQKRISKSQSTSQESIRSKWPKVSDEIEFDNNDDEDPFATLPRDTTLPQPTWYSSSDRPSIVTGRESQLSLSPNTNTRPCCIHPTVLRSFATPQPDTLHMKNVLLLGEDQYFGVVLLRSHPHHHLGFEPDAVGYATIPTNYWALQALQSRNLRAAFHNQVEMTRAARHIGFASWFLSFTKILDMILSMPIIIYLYGVFIRCFLRKGQAYYIIAISFSALFILHIVYFLIRRQFKYVIWFFLYCLFSVPLFAIWFPLVAVWCSDHAERWYDVWPTAGGWRWNDRLHGCVDDEYSRRVEQLHEKRRQRSGNGVVMEGEQKNSNNEGNGGDDEETDAVVRMQLGEYETIEAQRAYERATEETAALDAKFTGFTVFGQNQSLSNINSAASGVDVISPSPPPLAQMKDEYASFRGTTSGYRPVTSVGDIYGTMHTKRLGDNMEINDGDIDTDLLPRSRLTDGRTTSSPTDSLATNPFADNYDNPFDDGYAINNNIIINNNNNMNNNNNNNSNNNIDSTSSSIYPMAEVVTHHHHHHHHQYQPSLSSHQQQRQQYKQHKASHSQSSYFSHQSSRSYDYYNNAPDMFIPMEETISSSSGDGAGRDTMGHYRSYSAESAMPLPLDRQSVTSQTSITNSCLSLDPETTLECREYRDREDEEGRSMAIHGRVGLKIPERSAAAMTAAAYRQRQASYVNNKNDINIGTMRPQQQRRLHHHHQQQQQQQQRSVSRSSSIQHQRNTSDTSQHNATTFIELIQMEIRSYLSSADLDSTTRAQVKEHLATVLGDRTRLDSLQETINNCIEETTLQLLAQQSTL